MLRDMSRSYYILIMLIYYECIVILVNKLLFINNNLICAKQKQLFIEKENSKDKQITVNTDNIYLVFKTMESSF